MALHSLDRDVTVKMSAGVGRGLLLVQRNKHDLPLASNGRVVPQPNSRFDNARQNDQNISLQSPHLVNRSGCETAKRDLSIISDMPTSLSVREQWRDNLMAATSSSGQKWTVPVFALIYNRNNVISTSALARCQSEPADPNPIATTYTRSQPENKLSVLRKDLNIPGSPLARSSREPALGVGGSITA